ncbi:hypothetical protein [Chamaesiphon sp.]|uniref:hypothetical protein n=1 Tax=Chamaesiphon sp. TaxID=2814140 RepID=UPI00359346B3
MNTETDTATALTSEPQIVTLSRDMSTIIGLFKTHQRSLFWLSQEENIDIDLDSVDILEEKLTDFGDRLERFHTND